jgi:DNA segregation ATPase FtsK/SpoIIIE-like protein
MLSYENNPNNKLHCTYFNEISAAQYDFWQELEVKYKGKVIGTVKVEYNILLPTIANLSYAMLTTCTGLDGVNAINDLYEKNNHMVKAKNIDAFHDAKLYFYVFKWVTGGLHDARPTTLPVVATGVLLKHKAPTAVQTANKIAETFTKLGCNLGDAKFIYEAPAFTTFHYAAPFGEVYKKVIGLATQVGLQLQSKSAVTIKPDLSHSTISVQVANENRKLLELKDIVIPKDKYTLPIVVGRDEYNKDIILDLVDLPHLLIAGATKQGKSVTLNAMILTLAEFATVDVDFVMIDFKKSELQPLQPLIKRDINTNEFNDEYNETRYPFAVKAHETIDILHSLSKTMHNRNDEFAAKKVRNIKEYNSLKSLKQDKKIPYIVCVIDEFSYLMLSDFAKEANTVLSELAALGRAAGIHFILATQRPSSDVITGVIKAQFETRLAFRVADARNSNIILDRSLAENLLGAGDAILKYGIEFTRVQCPYIDIEGVSHKVAWICEQRRVVTIIVNSKNQTSLF